MQIAIFPAEAARLQFLYVCNLQQTCVRQVAYLIFYRGAGKNYTFCLHSSNFFVKLAKCEIKN